MTFNFYKLGFLFLAAICLSFVIPAKKVTAQEKYMFCPIDQNGRPASSHCESNLENCQRIASSPMNRGQVVCVARRETSSMLNN
jgi:hypothetical protein